MILALGINDRKARFFASAPDAADGAGVLVKIVQQSGAGPGGGSPAVLLVDPPPVGFLTELALILTGAEEESKRFSRQYHRVAEKYGCILLDTAEMISPSYWDGIHLEAKEHRKLSEAVAALMKTILSA